MSTISVITPPSEPGVVQLYAVGIDVSAAYVAGVSQATWWLSTQEARQLSYDLGTKLLPTVGGGSPASTMARMALIAWPSTTANASSASTDFCPFASTVS
ncbi:MAG TPA: hypothetical protein VGS60_10570 [Actinomycetes bacterium]|jgi:hypothetical protein|nr:hypothetical protein [Actinomycetes bacterium]